MGFIKGKVPNRYQLYLTCAITMVILTVYSGFTFSTRNAAVHKPPSNRIINTVLQDKTRQPSNCKGALIPDSTPCLKNAFRDILLVIVFNYPLYDSIPHLVTMYKPAFPNLLFCGPPDKISHPDILTVNIIRGYLGYECLGRAIRKHPGYKGYFYISDDVILKYWNFPDLDRDKFWESFRILKSPARGPPSGVWPWWTSPYGLKNCQRALEDVANMTLKENKLNGTGLINTLLKNGNGTLLCYGSRADVLYVPQRHAEAFSILSETFFKQNVFLEIAVPTIYRLLERNENISRLPGYYIIGNPEEGDSKFFWFLYLTHNEYYFMHPFKLHRGGTDSQFNFAMMKFIFMDKVKALTNCTAGN